MKSNKTLMILAVAGAAGSVMAGEPVMKKVDKAEEHAGDWCKGLETIGKLYENKKNPYIQEVEIFGRAQIQYGYVSGDDAAGQDFSDDFDEVRRLRLGVGVKAFEHFKLKMNVNLEDDQSASGGDRDFGYRDFDTAELSYERKDMLGLDEVGISYGRYKVAVGHEAHRSSREIKTVERSALSNKIADNRYTGVMLYGDKGTLDFTVGLLTLDDSDFLGSWNGGNLAYGSMDFDAMGGEFLFDFVYNMDADGSGKDDVGVGYEWVFSAAWRGDVGAGWDLMVNGVVGDNGSDMYQDSIDSNGRSRDRDDLFYGLVLLADRYLVDDKLEFVARYQWQGSDAANGIRVNSRYVRSAEDSKGLDLGSGARGDSHHSIYTGLNWYLCGDYSKVMTGVEHETIATENGEANATTLWLAYRMFF